MTRVLLGIDTEADDQWSAAGRDKLTLRNIAELPRLQKLCDQYGVRPTYLITYEVATDPESRSILRGLAKEGRCEIGSHHLCLLFIHPRAPNLINLRSASTMPA